jgi:ABC-type Zn uptake system ZnuABC Zn-binding protein ZnuA
MKQFMIVVLLVAAIIPAFAGGGAETNQEGKLAVVASTSLIADVAEQIAGDLIDLETIIKGDQDPHSYELVSGDLVNIEQAQIIFTNGFELEESILDTLESAAKGVIVEVSAGISPIEAEHDHGHDEAGEEAHHHHGEDPHTWFSVHNVETWALNIYETLADADPENADVYFSNYEAYVVELKELEEWIEEQVALIPAHKRMIISDHEVFSYFAADYGFEIEGSLIESFSTNSETTSANLIELIEHINKEQIPAVFVSSASSDAIFGLAETLQSEVDVDLQIVEYVSGLLSDDLTSYIEFMEYNVGQLVKGLGN